MLTGKEHIAKAIQSLRLEQRKIEKTIKHLESLETPTTVSDDSASFAKPTTRKTTGWTPAKRAAHGRKLRAAWRRRKANKG